jgi:hypothetical protein
VYHPSHSPQNIKQVVHAAEASFFPQTRIRISNSQLPKQLVFKEAIIIIINITTISSFFAFHIIHTAQIKVIILIISDYPIILNNLIEMKKKELWLKI